MTKLRSRRHPFAAFNHCIVVWLLMVSCLAYGQSNQSDQNRPNQEVRVTGLRTLVARSHEPSDVLLTSLDTIIHERSVCCGKDSALEDSAQRADPASLKDIAAKLQGRHLLSDGRPIMITAEYLEPSAIGPSMLIATLRDKHALLLEWNSRFYVCYGVTYWEYYDADSGGEVDTISTLLLLDTRYADARREAVFSRATDDWSKVQGMLWVAVAQP